MKIKSLPPSERPREKLIAYGPAFLSDSELLAIILGTGNKKENAISLSNKLFTTFNLKKMSQARVSNLKRTLGVGDAKACKIAACFELGRRLAAFRDDKKIVIKEARDLAKLLIPEISSLKQEHFRGVYLDSRKRILKSETLFIGSLNESVVHPREIFQIALEEHAAALILVHNHPSGDPNPSTFDIEITKELSKAGNILGIPVLDHIIIGDKNYFSLKEHGLI